MDATVIDLCLSLFPWANFRQTKGAVKVHVLLDHDGYFPTFAHITDGKGGDSRTCREQIAMSEHLPKGSILVVDRAYVDFTLFRMLTDRGVFFVTRLKEGMSWVAREHRAVPQRGGILRDDLIEFVGQRAALLGQHLLRLRGMGRPGDGRKIPVLDQSTSTLTLISVVIAWTSMSGVAAYSQDTLSWNYIEGRAIVRVSSSFEQYFWEIATDTSDMSQTASSIFDSLKMCSIQVVHAIGASSTSALSDYFLMIYDSTWNYDTVRSAIGHVLGVDTVMRDVAAHLPAYGCYTTQGGTEHLSDPGIGNAWWILSPGYVRDQDLDVEEAWEFTKGDANVMVGIFAGGNWCIRDEYRPQALWREFGSNIVDGINAWVIEEVGNLWIEVPRFYSQTTDGCSPFVNPPYNFGGDPHHSISVMRYIVAHHDTTCCGGTVGVAPSVSLYPVAHSNLSSNFKALDYMHAAGCRMVTISVGLPDTPEYEGWLQRSMDLNILPIIAVGNNGTGGCLGGDPQPLIQGPVYVAAGIGTYRSPATKYYQYPRVCLTSAAPSGCTSFAAATASGVAGLVLSMYPDLSTSQLQEKLLNACDPMQDELWDPDLNETKLGRGKLNAYRAIATEKSGTISSDETWSGPIFVSSDVTIPSGVTVTINLSTLENGVRRTHVRFAGESRTKPVQNIQPKITVYGSLIVEGETDERILFSSLQRCIPYNNEYIGQWGGIEVKPGGTINMEKVLIENCMLGVNIMSHDAYLHDVEFCNVGRAIIVQNYDPQYGEPIISSCKIHNAQNDPHYDDATGLGIGVWRGSPQITGCDISNVNVGIHYFSSFAKGTLSGNHIHDTWGHGVLCVSDCAPTIIENRIDENEGYGVSLMFTRKGIHLKDNVISNNGRKGLARSPFKRTADGLFMYNATARLQANTIDSNRCGLHLESFSTLIGGDGTVGPYGTSGLNSFSENDTTIVGNDHSKTVLGIYSGEHHYGHGNTMNVMPGGMQAVAKNTSDLWLQCNAWDPDDDARFSFAPGSPSRLFRFPYTGSCEPIGHPYPDDQFELAQDYLAQDDYVEACQIYASLAGTTVDSIVLGAVTGFLDTYAADSLHQHTVAIDSTLDYAAYLNRNGAYTVKANLAYAQAILATELNDFDKADSLYEYATTYLTSSEQRRNNMTANMYLELYKQADTTAALLILEKLELQFATDPLISIAQDMFRYYVDIEMGRYIRKRESGGDFDTGGRESVPDGVHLGQNYPNPVKETTVIPYSVAEDGRVQIMISDILGRPLKVLRDTHQAAGSHSIVFDASALPAGIYLCVLRTHVGSKMILMSVVD
jgi:hypothetical protein